MRQLATKNQKAGRDHRPAFNLVYRFLFEELEGSQKIVEGFHGVIAGVLHADFVAGIALFDNQLLGG